MCSENNCQDDVDSWKSIKASLRPCIWLNFVTVLCISVCFLWERKISGVKFCVYLLCVCSVAQSYLTLCHPMNYSPPGSTVLGISQARILEWVDISFSRGSSRSSNWTRISCGSCIGRQILYHSPPGKPICIYMLFKFSLSWLTLLSGFWGLCVFLKHLIKSLFPLLSKDFISLCSFISNCFISFEVMV